MLPKYIYILKGSSGDCYDGTEWDVAAYRTEEEAQKHLEAINHWFRQQVGSNPRFLTISEYSAACERCPFDRGIDDRGDGIDYSIHKLLLVCNVNDYLNNQTESELV